MGKVMSVASAVHPVVAAVSVKVSKTAYMGLLTLGGGCVRKVARGERSRLTAFARMTQTRAYVIEQWYRRYLRFFAGQHDLECDDAVTFSESGNPLQQPSFLYVPGLTAKAWHDTVSGVPVLEAAAPDIAVELTELRASQTSFIDYLEPGKMKLHEAGEWKRYELTDTRTRQFIVENCLRVPKTVAALKAVPRLERSFVSFSALAPGTHVLPHCGQTNTKLRIHLGIDVPNGCEMRVGTEVRPWREGRCSVFDDSFEHEVWNRGTSTRYVLLLDVYHPDLTDDEIGVLQHWHERLVTATSQAPRDT